MPIASTDGKYLVATYMAERQGVLPVWVRAPVRGKEYFSGLTRSKLYQLAGENKIRSVSIRAPGQLRGTRLFELRSILGFLESLQEGNNA